MAGADLLWENSTADWLVAGADLVWENRTTGWLADKPSEHSDYFMSGWIDFFAIVHIWLVNTKLPIHVFVMSLFRWKAGFGLASQ